MIQFLDGQLPDRFWSKCIPEPNGGCWLWLGATDSQGYGSIGHAGRVVSVHRLAYAALVGTVPDGMELDHTCRVRCCSNPAHLEPVMHRENVRRGNSPSAQNARATHCPQGHAYDDDNTYVWNGRSRGCRECIKRHSRNYRLRRKAGR